MYHLNYFFGIEKKIKKEILHSWLILHRRISISLFGIRTKKLLTLGAILGGVDSVNTLHYYLIKFKVWDDIFYVKFIFC